MKLSQIQEIFLKFDIPSPPISFSAKQSGNINRTYAVTTADGVQYILQRVNTYVFKDPDALMENVANVTAFLAKKIKRNGGDPMRETLNLLPAKNGGYYYRDPEDDAIWRIYYLVTDTIAYDAAVRSGILYEAAKAFGEFQRQLEDYPAETLHDTIPDFHNTAKRYEAFETAVAADEAGRVASVAEEIEMLRALKPYASLIVTGIEEGRIPVRVTHNDTKLNNILMDAESGRGLCVIDLDTVMPGSLLYDFGDSIRFAANNTAEDDPDLSRIFLRLDLYEEYVSGFLKGVGDAITKDEIALLPESVLILTYELALRFMTDYLNGDKYFKILSPDHNLVRTRAQLRLAEDIRQKLPLLRVMTEKYTKKQ
ncbi:MAG: aminoglycoside phosphotransferase family protein [Clostridia bacterium]|nr:aminoglycoside phosphotransferase family protein [Clostridia bacterium]